MVCVLSCQVYPAGASLPSNGLSQIFAQGCLQNLPLPPPANSVTPSGSSAHPPSISAPLTVATTLTTEQVKIVEMFGGRHRQSQHISNSFVKARVGALLKGHRQVFVLHEILDVSHFMVSNHQVLHVHRGTLLDPRNRGGEKCVSDKRAKGPWHIHPMKQTFSPWT